jgi:hypothetical protein
MTAKSKPIIFILNNAEIRRLEYDTSGGRNLLSNDNILFLSIDDNKPSRLIKKLVSGGLYTKGNILAKSPYGADKYEEITNANYAFAVEKYMYFSLFCNLLGAKKVTVQRLDKVSKSGTKSLDLIALISGHSPQISTKDTDLANLQYQIQIEDSFLGSKPALPQAQSFLVKNNLLGDTTMLSLLEIRKQTGNPIKSKKLSLNLSNETKRIFEIVGKIKIPTYLSEFSVRFNSTIHNSVEYMLTLEVKF